MRKQAVWIVRGKGGTVKRKMPENPMTTDEQRDLLIEMALRSGATEEEVEGLKKLCNTRFPRRRGEDCPECGLRNTSEFNWDTWICLTCGMQWRSDG
jgi:hypothetical protein